MRRGSALPKPVHVPQNQILCSMSQPFNGQLCEADIFALLSTRHVPLEVRTPSQSQTSAFHGTHVTTITPV